MKYVICCIIYVIHTLTCKLLYVLYTVNQYIINSNQQQFIKLINNYYKHLINYVIKKASSQCIRYSQSAVSYKQSPAYIIIKKASSHSRLVDKFWGVRK